MCVCVHVSGVCVCVCVCVCGMRLCWCVCVCVGVPYPQQHHSFHLTEGLTLSCWDLVTEPMEPPCRRTLACFNSKYASHQMDAQLK